LVEPTIKHIISTFTADNCAPSGPQERNSPLNARFRRVMYLGSMAAIESMVKKMGLPRSIP
jgi:hypothetical protein